MIKEIITVETKPSILISLGDRELERLEKEKLIEIEKLFAYTDMPVVLVFPKTNPAKIKSFQDLTKNTVKNIFIEDHRTSTLGQRTKLALEKLGLWEKIKTKVYQPKTSKMLLSYVVNREVDGAIVYKSCLLAEESERVLERINLIAQLPSNLYNPIPCYAVTLKYNHDRQLAQKFIQFLLSKKSEKILAEYKFSRPPKK